jgi:diamine N-acetyltransferase
MNITLQPVTATNWNSLITLKVREDQKGFVGSNLYSIAEAQFGFEFEENGQWDLHPFGIYDGDQPVGFLMCGYNFGHPAWQAYIFRLMVDEKRQGSGFGRSGMREIIEVFRAEDRIKAIGISYKPNNEVARQLYASLGFFETGDQLGEEVLAVLNLRNE